ncbi:hypothetical protein AOT83_23765 [Mycobacteroides sp. H001]|uniref:helix-turn-helix domain-containing protein n=1 Tax=Mycobacteroides TaxID=670516 RepID=UPI000712BF26|nr:MULTISPECIES: helix-turn-helix transcriptional regulator [Mycobacteroides]KRQ29539.1 hypothetical protein AOT86_05720 [Mycobacteroides sp. H072]KRQ42883.1 hypothetical protein AOT84_00045 [Mycobacteroides sp. H002]KRQ55653.1 hypothetical protein AOT85_01670 [Mycobacteroides sp. H054]KRQ66262.1 hypothetical protein AOT83_23765 [Mycobacteroides sp. H001]OHU32657.1 hypothetical protein BKG79_24005 [Mycobacteroides chelonae]
MSDFVLERMPPSSGFALAIGPATEYFVAQLHGLLRRCPRKGKTALTVGGKNGKRLHEMLTARAKATGKSMNGKSLSQCYRYVNGVKSPSLEVLVDIAELFAVSPHYFLLPDGDGNDSSYDSNEGARQ